MIILFHPQEPAATNNVKIPSRFLEWSSHSVIQESVTYLSNGLHINGKLFHPAGRKKQFPTIILNHDGVSGISTATIMRARDLVKNGFVVFTPSYRGEDGSDGSIEVAKGEVEDVLAAIEYLRLQPEVNSRKISLIGTSHGALISVLAAGRSNKIRAIVEAYGVMDIFKWWDYLLKYQGEPKDPLSKTIYGNGPNERPEAFHIRNAVEYVNQITAPVLIIQGAKDTVVPKEQAYLFKDSLANAGKKCDLFMAPNAKHGFLIYMEQLNGKELQEAKKAWSTILLFLSKHLQ